MTHCFAHASLLLFATACSSTTVRPQSPASLNPEIERKCQAAFAGMVRLLPRVVVGFAAGSNGKDWDQKAALAEEATRTEARKPSFLAACREMQLPAPVLECLTQPNKGTVDLDCFHAVGEALGKDLLRRLTTEEGQRNMPDDDLVRAVDDRVGALMGQMAGKFPELMARFTAAQRMVHCTMTFEEATSRGTFVDMRMPARQHYTRCAEEGYELLGLSEQAAGLLRLLHGHSPDSKKPVGTKGAESFDRLRAAARAKRLAYLRRYPREVIRWPVLTAKDAARDPFEND